MGYSVPQFGSHLTLRMKPGPAREVRRGTAETFCPLASFAGTAPHLLTASAKLVSFQEACLQAHTQAKEFAPEGLVARLFPE